VSGRRCERVVVVEDARGASALAELREAARAGRRLAGLVAGGAAYAKGGPLRGRARLRHGLRAALGLGLPRTRELANLRWLRARGFPAPEPLAALTTTRAGLPAWQGLVTARVERATDAAPALARADARTARARCRALGGLVGRLHAAGFLHRDLYVRNLLLCEDAVDAPPVVLDAWRGGPGGAARWTARLVGRDAAYDLACLFVHLPGLVDREACDACLEAYAEARALDRDERSALVARALPLRAQAAARERARARRDAGTIPREWRPRA